MEAVLGEYYLPDVPEDKPLRAKLQSYDLPALVEVLASYGPLHNTTDTGNKKRVIRAIEIAEYRTKHPAVLEGTEHQPLASKIFVIDVDREVRRARISSRLDVRLRDGLIEEVKGLLNEGLSAEDLIYYGLEYKFVTEYVVGERTFESMKEALEIAIHQFAKRQMTWLRGMERRGFSLTYIQPRETPRETSLYILDRLVDERIITI